MTGVSQTVVVQVEQPQRDSDSCEGVGFDVSDLEGAVVVGLMLGSRVG